MTARYLPEMGGTEIHTYETAERVQRLGADVTVITISGDGGSRRAAMPPPAAESEQTVSVVKVRAWLKRFDAYFAPGLLSALRATRPDIIHLQGFHTLVAPLAMLAGRRMNVRYIVTLHSGGHASRLRTALRPVQARLLRRLLINAYALVAGSEFEARQFARWLKLPVEHFVVLPSGVDLPVPPNRGPAEDGPQLILSVGRLESYKGHQAVLEALPALHQRHPGVRLRIAGSGRYERQLRKLACRLGVAQLVEISPVPAGHREDMALLLSRADVVVSLSSYESQGIAMQEALALGRPLVVSDAGALAELARYENVRVVPRNAGPAEICSAISALLGALPVTPPAMPTWDACAAGLVELYELALQARS